MHWLAFALVVSCAACAPGVGDPCAKRGEQDACPEEAICEAVDGPASVCETCTVEIDDTRVCRLRCKEDDDCDDDEECVEFTRFNPDVSYSFCRPLP